MKKESININSLPIQNHNNIIGFEKYDAKKVYALFAYLNLKLFLVADVRNKKWYLKTIKFLKNNIFQTEKELISFITPTHFFTLKEYSKLNFENNFKVGRLYAKNSMQNLPNEIRSLLFENDYVDFDIASSHPSIMLYHAIENNLTLNGMLAHYIAKKSEVIDSIKQEIKENSKIGDVDNKYIKKLILITLNKIDLDFLKNSKTLYLLNADFKVIRDDIWDSYCLGKLNNFKHAVSSSLKKKKKEYTRNNKIDLKILENKSKVILLSFYCQDRETFHLKNLSSFLIKNYKAFNLKQKKSHFSCYFPFTSKKVDLCSSFTLSITPFFDGLLISSPNEQFNKKLSCLIADFNANNGLGVAFIKKTFKKEFKYLNETEFQKFVILCDWLSKDKSLFFLNLLLQNENTNQKLTNILLSQIDKKEANLNSDFFDENIFDKNIEEQIVNLKNIIYEKLLSFPFKNEKELEDSIENFYKKK